MGDNNEIAPPQPPPPQAPPALTAEEKEQKMLKKRGFVVKELIATEKVYTEKLTVFSELFIDPIRREGILEPDDIHSQFLNWEIILGLHKALLANLIEQPDETAVKVGSIFGTFGHFLKMYMQYLTNYELALTRRANLLTSNKRFAQFIETAALDSRCKGEGLPSFLVAPVQRIPRYKMLLEEILKNTPESHEDYGALVSSLSKVSEVAIANNEAIRHREKKEEIMRIMMSFDSRTRINLLDEPTRVFKREAEFNRQCRRGFKVFKFWLFNDKILYGEALPGYGGLYTLNREILLTQCRVSEESGSETAFLIESPAKSFMVLASSAEERKSWLDDIASSIAVLREKYEIETGAIAPIWTPDASASQCAKCEVAFTVIIRRHHCRNCGNVLCDSCSSYRFVIPHVSQEPVRVCEGCCERLSGNSQKYARRSSIAMQMLSTAMSGVGLGRNSIAVNSPIPSKRPVRVARTASSSSIGSDGMGDDASSPPFPPSLEEPGSAETQNEYVSSGIATGSNNRNQSIALEDVQLPSEVTRETSSSNSKHNSADIVERKGTGASQDDTSLGKPANKRRGSYIVQENPLFAMMNAKPK